MLIRSTFSSRLRYMSGQTVRSGAELYRLQEQITTGKRINRLSDEPWSASEIHQLRAAVEKQGTYEDSAKQGQALLSTIEGALNTAVGIIDRAKVLAVQAGNDTYSAVEREGIATEALMLKERLAQVVNTQFHGRYLFSGAAHDTPPIDSSYAYNGSTAEATLYVSDVTSISVGLVGQDIFGDATGGMFKALDDFAVALQADDGDNIRSAINDFTGSFDQLNQVRTGVGLSTRIVFDMEELSQQLQLDLGTRLSSIEDADTAEVITQFGLMQTQYEINLQLTSASKSMTLFARI
jgi:flagellar hook-associated protein 3 FlgL